MDILERLRNLSWQIELAKVQADRREAADEIERLREDKEMWADATGKAANEIERLRSLLKNPTEKMLKAGRAANKLVAGNALGMDCIAPDAAWRVMADLVLAGNEE